MKEALDIVQNLDDVQAVMILQQIYQDVFNAISFEKIKEGVEDQWPVARLKSLDTDIMKQRIGSKESIELTRNMLTGFAEDEQLYKMVIYAWEKVENDDSLIIETIITLGIIANLTLFMATSELEFEFKGVTIRKGAASADQIKAVLSPLTELIKKIAPGIT